MTKNKDNSLQQVKNSQNKTDSSEYECPECQLGTMRLEPEFKLDAVYDVYTCSICEYMKTDYTIR